MANSKKKCKHCEAYIDAKDGLAIKSGFYCDMDHAIKFGQAQAQKKRERIAAKAEKEKRAHIRKRKAEINRTITHWKPKAQAIFNKFIRLRDIDLPCVSCGATVEEIESGPYRPGGYWDAGHFLGRGAMPELRFHEDNVHKQCKSCNGAEKNPKKRDTVAKEYEYRLRLRIGDDKVDFLKGPHELPRLRVDDYINVFEEYKLKVREIENARST